MSLEGQVSPYILIVLLYCQVFFPSAPLLPGLHEVNFVDKAYFCEGMIGSPLNIISNTEKEEEPKEGEIQDVYFKNKYLIHKSFS